MSVRYCTVLKMQNIKVKKKTRHLWVDYVKSTIVGSNTLNTMLYFKV